MKKSSFENQDTAAAGDEEPQPSPAIPATVHQEGGALPPTVHQEGGALPPTVHQEGNASAGGRNKLVVIGIIAVIAAALVVGLVVSQTELFGDPVEVPTASPPVDSQQPDTPRAGNAGHETPPPELSADPSPTPPAGMALIKGGNVQIGSSEAEWSAALTWCRQLDGQHKRPEPVACPEYVYRREGPPRQEKVASFFIDREEVTNAALTGWLNALEGLEIRPDDRGRPFAFSRDGHKLTIAFGQDHPLEPQIYSAKEGGRFATREGFLQHPATLVSWHAADLYCTSQGKRLPTAAEWELAARGSERRGHPWGSDGPSCDRVPFDRRPGGQCEALGIGTAAVGVSDGDTTPEGVHDLGGNATEWVSDYWIPSGDEPGVEDHCVPPTDSPPEGAVVCRVHRGGDVGRSAERTRAAAWNHLPQSALRTSLGFRCALDAR